MKPAFESYIVRIYRGKDSFFGIVEETATGKQAGFETFDELRRVLKSGIRGMPRREGKGEE